MITADCNIPSDYPASLSTFKIDVRDIGISYQNTQPLHNYYVYMYTNSGRIKQIHKNY